MKSKVNYKDNSYQLRISIKTWIFIRAAVALFVYKKHSPCFLSRFSSEFIEVNQLVNFNPPFSLDEDSFVTLTFKDYVA